MIAGIISAANIAPAPLAFIERDPSLSYQLTLPETVSTGTLLAVSLLVPICVFALVHVVQAVSSGLCGWTALKSVFVSLAWLLLTFAQCCILDFAVTGCIKIAVGRPRPNFFALCDYQGYKQAVATGNFTAYFAATTPGVFGNISNCRAEDWAVAEAQRSFPSGHASFSFGAMMFVTLYLRAVLAVPNNTHFSLAAVVAACPLTVSTFIAISRVRDRWHNPDDISVGSLIGIMSALVAWWHYRSLRRSGLFSTEGAGKLADEDQPAARALLGNADSSAGGSPVVAGSTASAAGATAPAITV